MTDLSEQSLEDALVEIGNAEALEDAYYALATMAQQYMEDDNGVLFDQFMSANQICIETLEKAGLVENDRFTDEGKRLIESRG